MIAAISDETRAAVEQAEPDFADEAGFTIEDEAPRRRAGPGRGHKGPMAGKRSHKKRAAGTSGAPGAAPVAAKVNLPPAEPPKALVRGCRWMLRNVVTVMKEAYGWDEPEDYEEWLTEASQFGAACVQKHFPDWMDRWGDEILFLAMLLLWVTPNVSKQLRERKKPNRGMPGAEGQRENDAALPLAESA